MGKGTNVTPDTLNDVMEFDRVIRVWPDGTVSYASAERVYAPEVCDNGNTVDEPWELMAGYSGQYSYRGPCMHPSEYIGGGMARDILAEPGWYVALVAEADCCDALGCAECSPYGGDPCPVDCDLCASDEPAGWVVARILAECQGHESFAGAHMGQTIECDTSCVTFPSRVLLTAQ